MNDTDLKDGQVYRLVRDVKNPKADKRGRNLRRTSLSQYEWAERMEMWPKGMRFRYVEREERGLVGEKTFTTRRIENFDGSIHRDIGPTRFDGEDHVPNPKWLVLVAALEPAPETFKVVFETIQREVCGTTYDSHDEILAILYKAGKFTQADLREAFEQWNKDVAAEDEKTRAADAAVDESN